MFKSEYIEFDADGVEEVLKTTTLNMNRITQKMMLAANRAVIKQGKRNFRALYDVSNHNYITQTRPGATNAGGLNARPILKNFTTFKSKKEFTTYIKNKSYYSGWLEEGAHVKAKAKRYLTFKANGSWHKVESVDIQAHPFFEPAFRQYYENGQANQIMQEMLQRELDKYYRRG